MSCKKLHEFVHSYVCLLIFLSFIAFICLTRLCGLRPMDPSACCGTLLQTDRRQPLNLPFRFLFVCIVFSYTDTDTFLKFLGYITIQSNPLTAPRCYLRPRHVINQRLATQNRHGLRWWSKSATLVNYFHQVCQWYIIQTLNFRVNLW